MKVLIAAFSLAAWLLLGACGYRENGESCWSDEVCISDYCSWGTCRPGLAEWIASWFRDEPERPPPPPPPPPAPPSYAPPVRVWPLCAWMEERECRVTPDCTWRPLCGDDLSPPEPDAGVVACGREHYETGVCPRGCTLSGICF